MSRDGRRNAPAMFPAPRPVPRPRRLSRLTAGRPEPWRTVTHHHQKVIGGYCDLRPSKADNLSTQVSYQLKDWRAGITSL